MAIAMVGRWLAGIAVCVGGLTALAVGASESISAVNAAEVELSSAHVAFTVAQQDFRVESLQIERRIAAFEARVAAASEAVEQSNDQVLDDANREALAQAVLDAQQHVEDARRQAADRAEVAMSMPVPQGAEAYRSATIDLAGADLGIDWVLDKDNAAIAAAEAAVAKDIVAWKAEVARLAAEAEAARLAAEEAARQAAAAAAANASGGGGGGGGGSSGGTGSSSGGGSGGGGASQGSTYYVSVRTWGDPWDLQATVDAGGQVAADYGGVINVTAHNYNDSTALALGIGDLVVFSGAMGGTYQVAGEMWVSVGASSSLLWNLGTPVTMQTCSWDNASMRIVGLVPVG